MTAPEDPTTAPVTTPVTTTTRVEKQAAKRRDLEADPKEMDPFDLDDRMACPRYLMSKGWRPLGSPHFERTRWEDPLRGRTDRYIDVPVIAPHYDGEDAITKKPLYKDKAVMVKDAHGRAIPCVQRRVIPAGRPYPLNEAMEIQLDRDREQAEAALRSQKAAA